MISGDFDPISAGVSTDGTPPEVQTPAEAMIQARGQALGSLLYTLALVHNDLIPKSTVTETEILRQAQELISGLHLNPFVRIQVPPSQDDPIKSDIAELAPQISNALKRQSISLRAMGRLVGCSHTQVAAVARGMGSRQLTHRIAAELNLVRTIGEQL